jgi:hypothetical protein
MARVRLTNPTGRNTQAHVVSFGYHSFYFSYETIVAYCGPNGIAVRRPNDWGPTTGRHLKELGVYDWTELNGRVFDELMSRFGNTGDEDFDDVVKEAVMLAQARDAA